jgi:hypothetical protein
MMTHDIEEYSPPRSLTREERRLVEHLLSVDFPGRHELQEQLPFLTVSAACSTCPSLDFSIPDHVTTADVSRRIPVEGKVSDEDGVSIHILLHVVHGRLSALEVYREDGSEIRKFPPLGSIQVLS